MANVLIKSEPLPEAMHATSGLLILFINKEFIKEFKVPSPPIAQ